MEKIGIAIERTMSALWIRNARHFDEKALWFLAEKAKYPYNRWAAEELIARKKKIVGIES